MDGEKSQIQLKPNWQTFINYGKKKARKVESMGTLPFWTKDNRKTIETHFMTQEYGFKKRSTGK